MKRRWLVFLSLGISLLGAGCDEEPLASALGELSADPEIVDFGPRPVGEYVENEVELRNDGRVPARVRFRGIASPFEGPAEVTVPAAGAVSVTFGFRPLERGEARATVSVESSDHGSLAIELRGEGAVPLLSVPESLDFGPVAVGREALRILEVRNESPLPIEDLRFDIVGPDKASFSVERMPRLGPGETGEFELAFRPMEVETIDAAFTVAPCTACENYVVILRGSGIDRALFAEPASLDFRHVLPGATRTRALRIGNAGDLPATLAEVRVEGDAFTAGGAPLPVELERDEEVTLDVTFSPDEIGDREGRLVFLDDTGAEALAVALRGHGGGPEVVVEPAAIDLGEVPFGWSGTAPVVVRNIGEPFPVELVSATIEGPADWSVATPPLPGDLDETGVVLDVGFAAPNVEWSEATLVLVTSDPDLPAVRVPLVARVNVGGSCQIGTFPSPLRFGIVMRHLAPFVRELELTNTGDEPCLLYGLALDPAGSWEFALVDPPVEHRLEPGETLVLEVSYDPGPGLDPVRTVLTYRTDSPAAPSGEVEISGWAPDFDLEARPNPTDFGFVPLGWTQEETFGLQHGWDHWRDVWFVGMRLVPGSHDSFSLLPAPPPFRIDGWRELGAVFAPTAGVNHRGIVELWVEEHRRNADPIPLPEPVIVLLQGQSGPCVEHCEPPVPICPGPASGLAGETITLTGSGIDPNGDPVTCEWTIVSAPPGSSNPLFQPHRCETLFLPDVAGEYTFRLQVRDPLGHMGECLTTYQATPPANGLWVELYWDVPNDVDLHLLHPLAGDPWDPLSWNDEVYDCHWTNQEPEWDDPGLADNPSLDEDDTLGTGPENIFVPAPSSAHPYYVGAIFFQQKTAGVDVHATANIFCHGVLVGTRRVTFYQLHDVAFLGTVSFAEDGTCSWVEAIPPAEP